MSKIQCSFHCILSFCLVTGEVTYLCSPEAQGCPMLVLFFPWLNPRISHMSKEPWFLSVEGGVCPLGVLIVIGVLVLPSLLIGQNWGTFTFIFISVSTLHIMFIQNTPNSCLSHRVSFCLFKNMTVPFILHRSVMLETLEFVEPLGSTIVTC